MSLKYYIVYKDLLVYTSSLKGRLTKRRPMVGGGGRGGEVSTRICVLVFKFGFSEGGIWGGGGEKEAAQAR